MRADVPPPRHARAIPDGGAAGLGVPGHSLPYAGPSRIRFQGFALRPPHRSLVRPVWRPPLANGKSVGNGRPGRKAVPQGGPAAVPPGRPGKMQPRRREARRERKCIQTHSSAEVPKTVKKEKMEATLPAPPRLTLVLNSSWRLGPLGVLGAAMHFLRVLLRALRAFAVRGGFRGGFRDARPWSASDT